MPRKRLLITIGSIVATLCAAAAAFSLTTGLVRDRANDGAGNLATVITVPARADTPSTPPPPVTVPLGRDADDRERPGRDADD